MDQVVHDQLAARRPACALAGTVAAALAMLIGGAVTAAAQQAVKAALTADIRVEPTRPGEKLVPGGFAKVTIAYRDATTGTAPPGLSPAAWIRRLDAGRPACERAAQSFRVTRALTRDDVPLFGAFIALENVDDTISIIDPKIDFQGSGMVSLQQMGEKPSAVAELASKQQLAVSLPDRGAVVTYSLPDLDEDWQSEPLARPGALVEAADGLLFAAEDGAGDIVKLDGGKIVGRWPVGPGPIRLVGIPASARFEASMIAIAANGAALWIEAPGGQEVVSLPTGAIPTRADVLSWAGGIAYADFAGKLVLRYRDSPSTVQAIDTRIAIEGMSLDAGGRYLLAWSNSALQAELVDLAFGKALQGFALAGPISNAVFSADTLFAGHAGLPAVSIVDLAPLSVGGEALVRPARLESADVDAPTGTPKVMVRAIGDSDNVVAFREGDRTLFILHGGAGHASPIVGTIALRGGRPADVKVLNRGLRETASGVFEAQVSLPRKGPLEIVATTGVGGVTTCRHIELDSAGGQDQPAEPRLVLVDGPRPRVGETMLVHIKLDGLAGPLPQSLQFMATVLPAGSWRTYIRAELAADGTYSAPMTFPAIGDYPLIPIGSGLGDKVAPLIIEVRS